MASRASISDHRNFKICSFLPDMTLQVNHLLHLVEQVVVFYHTLVEHETVNIQPSCITTATRPSRIYQNFSQLHCSSDEWNQLRLASRCSSHCRCLGRLWPLEVCPNQAVSDQFVLTIADPILRFFSLRLLLQFLLLGSVLKMLQNGKRR